MTREEVLKERIERMLRILGGTLEDLKGYAMNDKEYAIAVKAGEYLDKAERLVSCFPGHIPLHLKNAVKVPLSQHFLRVWEEHDETDWDKAKRETMREIRYSFRNIGRLAMRLAEEAEAVEDLDSVQKDVEEMNGEFLEGLAHSMSDEREEIVAEREIRKEDEE